MAITNVGTGPVGTGAAGAAFTPSNGALPRTAGDLLISWAFLRGTAAIFGVHPAGWTVLVGGGNGNGTDAVLIAYRVATGGDAAPTWPAVAGGTWTCQVGEFAGTSTSTPADISATNDAPAGGTMTATTTHTPAQNGELVISVGSIKYAVAAAHNLAQSYNNGAADNNTANNNATATVDHFTFDWGIITSNAANQSGTVSYPGAATQGAVAVGLFQPGGVPLRTLLGVGT